MSNPKQSGMLTGGGRKGAKIRRNVVRGSLLRRHPRFEDFPDVHITDSYEVKSRVPAFEEGREYSQRQLMLLAEKMILEDPKPLKEEPYVLSMDQYRERMRREIYVADGIPQPHVVQGMYWRTHPQGRKWADKDKRKRTSQGFYR